MTTHSSLSPELQKELTTILQREDEAQFRKFISEHLKEFPENVQDAIIVALLEDVLEKQNEEKNLMMKFRKGELAALDILGGAKTEIERHVRLNEIRESI